MSFEIEWFEKADMEIVARAHGWRPGLCVLDFIDETVFAHTTRFNAFPQARAAARQVMEQGRDYFGQVHIYRQVCVAYRNGDLIWETTAIWVGRTPQEVANFDVGKPTKLYPLDLGEDDRVVA